MALRLTFDIFSGRPNPTVVVDGLEARELAERLRAPSAKSAARAAPAPTSVLGYRGIVIEQAGTQVRSLPTRFRVVGGQLQSPDGVRAIADPRFEDFVCGSTGPIRLYGQGGDWPPRLLEQLERYREIVTRWPGRLPPILTRLRCRCAPLWEPAWWNDAGQVQWNNNCYNYASNYRSDTYAQPGLGAGAMYGQITCAEVKAGAIADKLINTPKANNVCPKEGHLVALVVGPHWDFHWYRKGRNGRWTHKPGGTEATHVDNSGNVITDPRTADRGNYTDFCTFMVVMHGHIKLQ